MGASILLLGTCHMSGDESWLKPDRQREITDVVDRLVSFEPDVIAVECLPKHEPQVQGRYESWRGGEGGLDSSEIDQLAFRLAARCGVGRLNGFDADWQLDWDGLRELYDSDEAIERDMLAIAAEVGGPVHIETSRLLDTSFREALVFMNSDEYLAADHRMYLRIAELGARTNHGGALYTASWYRRNIRMYSNLCALDRTGAERIFALVGVGHAAIIRELIVQGGRFDRVDPASVLS